MTQVGIFVFVLHPFFFFATDFLFAFLIQMIDPSWKDETHVPSHGVHAISAPSVAPPKVFLCMSPYSA